MCRHRQQGFNLAETAVALAISGLLVSAALPALLVGSGEQRVRLAAQQMVVALRLARIHAARESARVGVKFLDRGDGRIGFRLYRDGDGDGVRSRDIAAGVDPPLGGERWLEQAGAAVGFGFPPGPAPRDPGNPRRRLRRLDDPIRFNRSDLASFDPLGTSTPGSLYLTDGRRALAVVRVLGRTGRVRVLVYDPDEERWH